MYPVRTQQRTKPNEWPHLFRLGPYRNLDLTWFGFWLKRKEFKQFRPPAGSSWKLRLLVVFPLFGEIGTGNSSRVELGQWSSGKEQGPCRGFEAHQDVTQWECKKGGCSQAVAGQASLQTTWPCDDIILGEARTKTTICPHVAPPARWALKGNV